MYKTPSTPPQKQDITLRLCSPRGFCAGVDRAIQIVLLSLKKYGAPVYVRHEIVHNQYVVEALKEQGAIFIQELEEIPPSHRKKPVVFSAHGVAKSVVAYAQKHEIFYLDATCPLVSKVQKQALRHHRLGRRVIVIGHAHHPEVVALIGQLPKGCVILVENIEQAKNLTCPEDAALGYVSQTTLSLQDTQAIIAVLEQRFSCLAAPAAESICYATTNRQDAVQSAAKDCAHFFVVGSQNSSNSRRLVEVAKTAGAAEATLIQSVEDINWASIKKGDIIGFSAGASAPEILVNTVLKAFKERYNARLELVQTAIEKESFLVNRELRDIALTSEERLF